MRKVSPFFLLSLVAAACWLQGCVIVQVGVTNPIPGLTRVAVVPFFNLSSEPVVDGRFFASTYATELQKVPGYQVIPNDVTERAIIEHELAMNSPKDALRLAEILNVDAVVLGAVTEYDPYYPPRIGLQVSWYSPYEWDFEPGVQADMYARRRLNWDPDPNGVMWEHPGEEEGWERVMRVKRKAERAGRRVHEIIRSQNADPAAAPVQGEKIIIRPPVTQPQSSGALSRASRLKDAIWSENWQEKIGSSATGANAHPPGASANGTQSIDPNTPAQANEAKANASEMPAGSPAAPTNPADAAQGAKPDGMNAGDEEEFSKLRWLWDSEPLMPVRLGIKLGTFKFDEAQEELLVEKQVMHDRYHYYVDWATHTDEQEPDPTLPSPGPGFDRNVKDFQIDPNHPERRELIENHTKRPKPTVHDLGVGLPAYPQPLEPPKHDPLSPLMSYTRTFDGRDTDLLAQLRDYLEVNDDLRAGGWEGYLQRNEDFVRFTSHLMIVEMLTLHGGEGQKRIIFKLRKYR